MHLALTTHHVHGGEWLQGCLGTDAGQDPGRGYRKGPGMMGHTQSWRDGLEQGVRGPEASHGSATYCCRITDESLTIIHTCMHAFIYSLIHSFNKRLQRTNSGPGPMLCTEVIKIQVLPSRNSQSRISMNIGDVFLETCSDSNKGGDR